MKKIFLCLLLLNMQQLFAQPYTPGHFPNDGTADAGMLKLVADKYVMELNENDMLTVRINWVNPGDNETVPQQYDYNFEDPSRTPWKITKWEILEGGGTLTEGPGHYYASYVSPATMPAHKQVTIAVTLEPQIPNRPKVQLLQTIYIVDNENVFYYNCPAYGVQQEKYILTANSGLLQSSNTSTTQQAINAGNASQQAQLAALQKQLDQVNQVARQTGGSKDMDIDLMTSNVKAMYTKDKDFTTLQFEGKNVAMIKGISSNAARHFFITITFPGEKTGTFKIKSKDIIAASITIMEGMSGKPCTCAFDPSRDPKVNPPCSGGFITITKYDTKLGGYVEGTVNANIQGAVGQNIIFGDLNGKFRVKLAKDN